MSKFNEYFKAYLATKKPDVNVHVKVDVDWLMIVVAISVVMVIYKELFL